MLRQTQAKNSLNLSRNGFEELRPYGNFPLDGKYLNECIVYQANVITNNECKEHFGTAEGEFKLRCNNHTISVRHKKRVNDTELSK